jgi:putative peptidoglycan lipid II flippase
VLAVLALVTAAIVLIGVLAAPLLVDLLAPGFSGDKRSLTIQLVRIIFPGVGVLVLSAWCLGVLNSHGRFLLSYSAPVAWNLVIIGAALAAGVSRTPGELVVVIAWAAVAGSLLQLGVQLPGVRRLLAERGTAVDTGGAGTGVRMVARNFGPSVLSRGVIQISAWVDMLIATLLGSGAAAALATAQMISTLPVSLFGMSISAAELPAMSARTGAHEPEAELRERLERGWRRIAYFVVPSAAAFLALGHVLAGTLFQSGAFTAADSAYVWVILAGASVGLLATTLARLASSTFHALGDTRTPFRFAALRMAIGVSLGVTFALVLPARMGLDPRYGVAGLSLAGGIAGWVEFGLLRRALAQRIGPVHVGARRILGLWAAAGVAAVLAWLPLLGGVMAWSPLLGGSAVLLVFGASYLGVTWLLGVPEARALGRWGTRHG